MHNVCYNKLYNTVYYCVKGSHVLKFIMVNSTVHMSLLDIYSSKFSQLACFDKKKKKENPWVFQHGLMSNVQYGGIIKDDNLDDKHLPTVNLSLFDTLHGWLLAAYGAVVITDVKDKWPSGLPYGKQAGYSEATLTFSPHAKSCKR